MSFATITQLEKLQKRVQTEEASRKSGDAALQGTVNAQAKQIADLDARLTALAEAPAEEPTPEPTPAPASGLIIALDAGNYGTDGAADVKACVNHVRCDVDRGPSMLNNFKAAGLRMNLNFSGPDDTGGVSALDADEWAAQALAFYKANTNPTQTPVIEALNEPGGTWFWGSNAVSQTNADAYRNLLRRTHDAFHAEYGAQAPKILGTLDGSGGLVFGQRWWRSECAGFVDGVIVHPYGGTGTRASSALGNRKLIEEAHALTGAPVYVTEVGWPTAVGKSNTGDSLQWSEQEQAANIKGFLDWARGVDYLRQVVYFNYRDYADNTWYGVVRTDGTHKPSYDVLRSAALA